MQPYIHKTEGRLRIRSIAIKQQPTQVLALLKRLKQAQGIVQVQRKKYAGSVTVLFDPAVIDHDTILAVFDSQGLLRSDLSEDVVSRVVVRGSKMICRTLLGVAAQRALGPNTARLLASL